jgi:anti-anti-sigma regulatory factor
MIIVDMHDVLRVDFSFGGALVNQVSRAEAAKKSVRFIRTSPIVLSLLLLVGLPSRMFSRHR